MLLKELGLDRGLCHCKLCCPRHKWLSPEHRSDGGLVLILKMAKSTEDIGYLSDESDFYGKHEDF